VPRAAFNPIIFATAAVLLGAPAYVALRHWGVPPPALLDRPWPLELAIVVIVLGAVYAAFRARPGWPRRAATGSAIVAVASLVSLVALAARPLPAPSAEIRVGSALPETRPVDERGQPVALASLRGHPTILVLYRGALCVSCRAQLVAFAAHAAPYIKAGVRLFGVSSDPPSVSAEWKSTLRLPFSLLSDERQNVAQTLCGARAHCLLLIDPNGKVVWGALNDYWRGAEAPETVLLAAYRLEHRD
jgi:peroxiredoxin